MDRGYLDLQRLYRMHQSQAFFVTRVEKTIRLSTSVFASHRQEDRLAVRPDRSAQQSGSQAWLSRAAAPGTILRWGEPKAICLMNNFLLPALTITQLYQCRWKVELFFSLDQAASAHQGLLWHIAECGQNASVDRYRRLRVGCDRSRNV